MTQTAPFHILHEARPNAHITWTPSLLLSAELRADFGDLRLAGELCEAMMGDDRLPGVLRSRVQGLLGLIPSFEPSGDGRTRNRAVKALEAGEDWWQIFPEDEHALERSYALLMGIAPVELQWEEKLPKGKIVARYRDGRLVPTIKLWYPRGLQYDHAKDEWTIALLDGSRVPVVAGNGQWMLDCPFGSRRPWLHGLWRGAKEWWLLKQYARADWAEVGERGSQTVVESEKDAPGTKDLRKELASQIADLAMRGICVLPPGFKLKLIELGAITSEIYHAQIAAADQAFAVMVLGHANNAEVQGANTGATAGQELRYDLRKFDGNTTSSFARSQALTHWAEKNFGSPDLAPWPAYPTDPPRDDASRATTLGALGAGVAALIAVDEGVDVRAILESYEVPIIKGAPRPEDVPKPEPVAPPAPTPGDKPAPDANGDVPPPDDKPAKGRAAPLIVRASKSPTAAAVASQVWTDGVLDKALHGAPGLMAPFLKKVLRAVDVCTSPEQLRVRLIELANESHDPDMQTAIEHMLMLTFGAGAAGVAREADA